LIQAVVTQAEMKEVPILWSPNRKTASPNLHAIVAVLATVFLVLMASRTEAKVISPFDAAAHVGQAVTVEGVASEVFTDKRSGTTFIDMGGRYPNNVFTGVIFRNYAGAFGDVHRLEGKTVGITGRVQMYKGKPEIILKNRSQLSPP
jgi:hypothetical protein